MSRRGGMTAPRLGILLLAAAGLCLAIWNLSARRQAPAAQAGIIGALAGQPEGSYARITGPRPLVFPRDDGPHPEFQTEWWYYTGNLQDQAGRRFGFQLTFFRRSVTPMSSWTPRPSDWATNQVYLAHFTLTDVTAQKFHYFERYERGAAGLAGATIDPTFQVWLHDWSVKQSGPNEYQLHAAQGDIQLDLRLVDTKGRVLQGDRGYSQKGPDPGNASLYYSQTHLESQGAITLGDQSFAVTGLAWMDREISTSALSREEVGWDWFALQLDDGSELMIYMLRRADGSISEFSSGLFVSTDGSTRRLSRQEFQITSTATWRSPHSGAAYPSGWQVKVPALELELQVKPLLADQELNVSFTYWEGAVGLTGRRADRAVTGHGYVELTGYARSMGGQF